MVRPSVKAQYNTSREIPTPVLSKMTKSTVLVPTVGLMEASALGNSLTANGMGIRQLIMPVVQSSTGGSSEAITKKSSSAILLRKLGSNESQLKICISN